MDGYDEYLRLGREAAFACRFVGGEHASWAGGFYGIDIQLDGPWLLRVAPPWADEFGDDEWRWFVDYEDGTVISSGSFGILNADEVGQAVAGLLDCPRVLMGREP